MRKYTRLNGESMGEFQARCRREQDAQGLGWQGANQGKRKGRSRAVPAYSAEQRNADRIDGYDRDDLGLSPDY